MVLRNWELIGAAVIVLAAGGLLVTAADSKGSVRSFLVNAHICSVPPAPAADKERRFLSENMRAMDRMMKGMAARPTGDIDADFAAMMIPHHQGAIDMAVLELRYGHNEQLRRIAQEIIVDQQQEIAAMKLALGQPLPPSTPALTQSGEPRTRPASSAAAIDSKKDEP